MPSRDVVDALLKELLDQVSGMEVSKITLTPINPAEDQEVTALIDVVGGGSVICTITPDGRLQSAQVLGS